MAQSKFRLQSVFLMTICAVLGLTSTALTTPARAQQAPKAYAISHQDLGAALRAFAIASGKDVVFDAALVKGKTTRGVQGQFSDEDALTRLLAGSGLAFGRTSTGGFVIRSGQPPPAPTSE